MLQWDHMKGDLDVPLRHQKKALAERIKTSNTGDKPNTKDGLVFLLSL